MNWHPADCAHESVVQGSLSLQVIAVPPQVPFKQESSVVHGVVVGAGEGVEGMEAATAVVAGVVGARVVIVAIRRRARADADHA
jgi:hypothetical protein